MKKHFDLWDPFSPGISPRFSFSSGQAAASPRGGGGGAVPPSPPAKAGALTSRVALWGWPGRPVPGPAPGRRRYSSCPFCGQDCRGGMDAASGSPGTTQDGIPETAPGPTVPLTPLTLRGGGGGGGGAPPTTAHNSPTTAHNSLKESSTLAVPTSFPLSPLLHPLLTPSQLPSLKSPSQWWLRPHPLGQSLDPLPCTCQPLPHPTLPSSVVRSRGSNPPTPQQWLQSCVQPWPPLRSRWCLELRLRVRGSRGSCTQQATLGSTGPPDPLFRHPPFLAEGSPVRVAAQPGSWRHPPARPTISSKPWPPLGITFSLVPP